MTTCARVDAPSLRCREEAVAALWRWPRDPDPFPVCSDHQAEVEWTWTLNGRVPDWRPVPLFEMGVAG